VLSVWTILRTKTCASAAKTAASRTTTAPSVWRIGRDGIDLQPRRQDHEHAREAKGDHRQAEGPDGLAQEHRREDTTRIGAA
jgi:hypothetical protein